MQPFSCDISNSVINYLHPTATNTRQLRICSHPKAPKGAVQVFVFFDNIPFIKLFMFEFSGAANRTT